MSPWTPPSCVFPRESVHTCGEHPRCQDWPRRAGRLFPWFAQEKGTNTSCCREPRLPPGVLIPMTSQLAEDAELDKARVASPAPWRPALRNCEQWWGDEAVPPHLATLGSVMSLHLHYWALRMLRGQPRPLHPPQGAEAREGWAPSFSQGK